MTKRRHPNSSLWPSSVRARLLLAFAVLFISAMALALVGWIGIRATQDALNDFQSHALPDVARALELSQRTAAIAAMAPYVADSTRPFQLQSEEQALLARLADAEKLAQSLPPARSSHLDVQPALLALAASIKELIEVTRRDLFLKEDLREYLYRLSSVASEQAPTSGQEKIDALLRDLMMAVEVSDPEILSQLRTRITRHSGEIKRGNLASARIANLIRDNLEGPENLFHLRERQFQLRERKAFLVSRTRAEAERLGERVDAYVHHTRTEVDRRGESLKQTTRTGALGITLLTVVCIIVAAFGIRVVILMLTSLASITQIMSKLAQGDTEQSTPETARRDELGALARAFEVFRDNARAVRRMTNDIREQGNLLTTVVESMKDGLSVFDRNGRLISWNRQYPLLLNINRAAIRHGMTLEEIQAYLPERINDGAGAPSMLSEFNRARQSHAYRFELSFADGRVVEFRSNPMPGGGFVTLYSDLTERRSVEAQLRQARKMEVLGQLTGGVAHDFNNLLAAITGNLYLLEQDPSLPASGQRFTARALSAAERGATLTRRLLAFARLQPLSPSPVDIDAFLRDLSDLIEYSIGQDVALELDLKAAPACAWVDRGQLENALLNLAINARDAMPEGGCLRLGSRFDVNSDQVCIDISDTGHGMTHDVRERVFEPFFTTKTGAGSGLGLSIVYGFIKQSGGDVHLATAPGEGTTFSLCLPAHPREIQSLPPAALAASSCACLSVLLVEDDPDVRSALADLIGAEGHAVTVAENFHAAQQAIEQSEYALVLSDVDLGEGKNGVELMHWIAERRPPCLRILMSGLPGEILSTRFGLAEGHPLLFKPFTVPQFYAALSQATSYFECENT